MLDNILFTLGIKSYNVKFPFVSKKDIFRLNDSNFPYEKFKMIYKLKLMKPTIENYDELDYGIEPNDEPTLNILDKIYYTLYTFYFLCVNVLLSTQSIYNIIRWASTNDTRHLVSFLTHINVPLIHIWAKNYFMCNHMEKILDCKKFKTLIIVIFTLTSLVLNFIDIEAFKNDYMWPTTVTDNTYIFSFLIIIDWFYSRLLSFLFLFTIVFVLKTHILELSRLKNDISRPEEYFLENSCINGVLIEISVIRDKIKKTIELFNYIISISTLIGAANLSLFIRSILPTKNISISNILINLVPFDRYLFVCSMIYTFIQIALLSYIYFYTSTRESILDYIKSQTFIKIFLQRLNITSCKNIDINLINLSTSFDTSNSIEWLILCDILSNRWVEFTIFGISTSDGKLLMKGLTLGGTIIFVLTFIAK
jgi:hypothetical protein